MYEEKVLAVIENTTPGISYKATRRLLYSCCGKELIKHKPTRKLLDNVAKKAVLAYNIGKEDGAAGAQKQKLENLVFMPDVTELQKACFKYVYVSYEAGYSMGASCKFADKEVKNELI